jgi:hypothetical protein
MTTYDPHGTLNPRYDAERARFRLVVQEHDAAEESGWTHKLLLIDYRYLNSDGYPIDAIAAGNTWQEAFSSAAHMVESALAADHCIF